MANDTNPDRPAEAETSNTTFLYYHDPKLDLAVAVGKVYVDEAGDAWVRLDKDTLATTLGVEDIDGVALLDHEHFIQPDA